MYISNINYINFTDNNPLQAAKAFANQKQYWTDFNTLFNSEYLQSRRGGNRINVNESELALAQKKGGYLDFDVSRTSKGNLAIKHNEFVPEKQVTTADHNPDRNFNNDSPFTK